MTILLHLMNWEEVGDACPLWRGRLLDYFVPKPRQRLLVSFLAKLVYIQDSLLCISEGSQSCSVRSPNQVLDIHHWRRGEMCGALTSPCGNVPLGCCNSMRRPALFSPILPLHSPLHPCLGQSPSSNTRFLPLIPFSLNIRWL